MNNAVAEKGTAIQTTVLASAKAKGKPLGCILGDGQGDLELGPLNRTAPLTATATSMEGIKSAIARAGSVNQHATTARKSTRPRLPEALKQGGRRLAIAVPSPVWWLAAVSQAPKGRQFTSRFNWLKNARGVEKCGHADSHWSYIQQPPGERPACPRVYFTMHLGFEAIGT